MTNPQTPAPTDEKLIAMSKNGQVKFKEGVFFVWVRTELANRLASKIAEVGRLKGISKKYAEIIIRNGEQIKHLMELPDTLYDQITHLEQQLKTATESFSLITCADHKESQRIANDWLKEKDSEVPG